MMNDKGIFIKNIYYMLAYAFQVLRQKNYEDVASEEFEEVQDLFAAILARGIAQQLKQGLYREYITRNEDLPMLRGKLNLQGTIRSQIQRKKLLSCELDELSVNNVFNRILKTTAQILMRDSNVKQKNKKALKKGLLFFGEVYGIEPAEIRWHFLTTICTGCLKNLFWNILNGIIHI